MGMSRLDHSYSLQLREGEKQRERHHVSSSHLGLISLPLFGVRCVVCMQTSCDKLGNLMQVSLLHKVHHCACILLKHPVIPIANALQGLT